MSSHFARISLLKFCQWFCLLGTAHTCYHCIILSTAVYGQLNFFCQAGNGEGFAQNHGDVQRIVMRLHPSLKSGFKRICFGFIWGHESQQSWIYDGLAPSHFLKHFLGRGSRTKPSRATITGKGKQPKVYCLIQLIIKLAIPSIARRKDRNSSPSLTVPSCLRVRLGWWL